MTEYENRLDNLPHEHRHMKAALIRVLDTAYFVQLWMRGYGIEPTAEGVAMLTNRVLDEETSSAEE